MLHLHQGRCPIEAGKYSQSASEFNFDDEGTCRLLEGHTLELIGRLGFSARTRRKRPQIEKGMKLTRRILLCLATLSGLVLAGCGNAPSAGSGESGLTPPARNSPVGVWVREFQDGVGQHHLEVLEIYNDNTYSRHAQGWAADRGRYALSQGMMAFRSEANQRHNRDVRIDVRRGKTMTMTVMGPLPTTEEWTRSLLQPIFPTVELDGRRVPQGLPGLAAMALASEVLSWRADAVPTGVRVQEQENGHYAVEFSYYSPSATELMRIDVTRYDIRRSTHDGSRTITAALPPDFLDLPETLAVATASGVGGPLKRASVQTYPRHGAVWSINTTAPRGANISAESGEQIRGDVTGYVAGYEEDWKRAGELWRKAMELYAPKKEDSYDSWKRERRRGATSKSTCEGTYGGTWQRSPGSPAGGFCS